MGMVDKAITFFQRALQLRPDYAGAQNNLGNALLKKGSYAEAIAHYELGLQIQPTDASAQNNLAWILATCPDGALRNGAKAVALAQQAESLTGGGNPVILHTLAAALADDGKYAKAVETAQRALVLAEGQSNPSLTQQLQLELKFYQNGQPFRSAATRQ
jgi:tetratricopeptide (TPR) repeat protein